MQTLLNILLFRERVIQDYEVRLKKHCCPNKLPECVANFCCLFFIFRWKIYHDKHTFYISDKFLNLNLDIRPFGQNAARDYKVRLRKNCFSVSCPNMWQFFVNFLIFNENYECLWILFLVFGQIFERISIFGHFGQSASHNCNLSLRK